jgi:polyisoprenoid-binding protein YceI
MAPYRFDAGQSRFQVQAFVAGLLSFAGHSPTFAVRDFQGTMTVEGDVSQLVSLEMTIAPDSLELLDRVSDSDRKEIDRRTREEVLETRAYRDIVFRVPDTTVDRVDGGRYRVRINGQLSLHGVTRSHRMNAELQAVDDTIRLVGETPLHMSDYKIKPVSALGGTIKLKDELKLTFDIKARPETS